MAEGGLPEIPDEVRETTARAEAESQQQLTASATRFVFIFVLVFMALSFLEPKNDPLTTVIFFGSELSMVALSEWQIQKRRFRAAAWILTTTLFVDVAAATWLFGGLQGEMGAAYVLVVLLAASTLGGMGALFFGSLSAVATTWVAWCQANELLPAPLSEQSVLNSWISLTSSILVSSLLARATLKNMRRSWETASQAAWDREVAEKKYILAQRLEPVGRLASGIAHDFNNMLSVVMQCSNALREEIDEDAHGILDILDSATARAELMTNQLLNLNRKRTLVHEKLEIGEWLEQFAPVLARLMGDDVRVEVNVQQSEAWVMVDRGQFEQVLLNLAVNARQAMPAGGNLSVSVRVEDGTVELKVSDNGQGMDEVTLANIFTPFFSTKQRGTGLGLATVRDILERHQGTVKARSRPGEGTVFTISLPGTVAPSVPPSSKKPPRPMVSGLRMLVVEDNSEVRAGLVRTLQLLGHEVWAVANGRQALALIGGDFMPEVVVSDVSMPEMGGEELFERLGNVAPQARVVLISGGVSDVSRSVLEDPRLLAFLKKPASRAQLLSALGALSSISDAKKLA